MCKLHDQFYNENKDTKDRNISDVALAHRADEIARDSNYDDVQRKEIYLWYNENESSSRIRLKTSENQKSKNSKRHPETSPGTSPGKSHGTKN